MSGMDDQKVLNYEARELDMRQTIFLMFVTFGVILVIGTCCILCSWESTKRNVKLMILLIMDEDEEPAKLNPRLEEYLADE